MVAHAESNITQFCAAGSLVVFSCGIGKTLQHSTGAVFLSVHTVLRHRTRLWRQWSGCPLKFMNSLLNHCLRKKHTYPKSTVKIATAKTNKMQIKMLNASSVACQVISHQSIHNIGEVWLGILWRKKLLRWFCLLNITRSWFSDVYSGPSKGWASFLVQKRHGHSSVHCPQCGSLTHDWNSNIHCCDKVGRESRNVYFYEVPYRWIDVILFVY